MAGLEEIYTVTDTFSDCHYYKKNPKTIDKEKLDVLVNFEIVDTNIKTAINQLDAKKISPDKLDLFLGPALHFSLKDVPAQILNNDGFWTYLSLIRFRNFAMSRAQISVFSDAETDIYKWIGNSVLRAQSRHLLRRVFNVCDVIVDKDNLKETYKKSASSYADCLHILRVQDAIQQIGDRRLSFNKTLIRQQIPALIKIIKSAKGDKKKKLQGHFNRLNALSTTRLFSYLNANELKTL
jgi:hypothetical protein